MKKFKVLLLVMLCFTCVLGCKKEKILEDQENIQEKFVLKLRDVSKDIVYLEDYKTMQLLGGNTYKLQNLVLNIVGEASDNINLELSSFVKKNYKEMKITNGVLEQGKIIYYDFYVSGSFITIIQHYVSYVNGESGEERDNVYVFSKLDGNVLNGEDLLKRFGYDEEKLYKELEDGIESEDVLYSLMIIKNNGYELYVNEEEKLVILYYELGEEETLRKEFVLGNKKEDKFN